MTVAQIYITEGGGQTADQLKITLSSIRIFSPFSVPETNTFITI
jgi:hypothetical protein